MFFCMFTPPKLEGEDEAILALQEFCFFLDGVVVQKTIFKFTTWRLDIFPEKKGLGAMTKSGETSENVD